MEYLAQTESVETQNSVTITVPVGSYVAADCNFACKLYRKKDLIMKTIVEDRLGCSKAFIANSVLRAQPRSPGSGPEVTAHAGTPPHTPPASPTQR